jgi:lipoprotein-anchoring transpeptidase ErfK/SrfK
MIRKGFSIVYTLVGSVFVAVLGFVALVASDLRPPSPAAETLAMATSQPAANAPADAPAATEPAPASPTPAPAPEAAPASDELRIVVSTRRRMLWLVRGTDTIMKAPVAIGMNEDFEYNGRKYRFETPRGRRRVIAKTPDPVWTPPEWHYYEKAAKKGLEAVKLEVGDTITLEDGSILAVTDSTIGRINQFGHFAEITPGVEIIFDGRIFIPPLTFPQRRVADALGPFKLDMGDGYLIHGTHYYNEESIGEAVSHGCVRMRNEDVTRLYRLVPRGTVVEIG